MKFFFRTIQNILFRHGLATKSVFVLPEANPEAVAVDEDADAVRIAFLRSFPMALRQIVLRQLFL